MQTHVRALGIIHIVFGCIGLIGGLAAFLFFGGIGGFIGAADTSGDAWVALPILGGIGFSVLVLALVLSLPGIIAGVGVLSYRPWARILMIVLSVLHILNFPFGTALGAYGLWVLLSPETTAAFQPRNRLPA